MRLFVNVCVLPVVGISTHSTASIPAADRVTVVSEAWPMFTHVNCGLADVLISCIASIAPAAKERLEPTVNSSTAPVLAVVRPSKRAVAIVSQLDVKAHAFTRLTHSTAMTPADTRVIVVSLA